VAVCRCLRGASRSDRSMPSIASRYGSNRGDGHTGTFRVGGAADASACRTVRRCTPCRAANAPDRQTLHSRIPADRREQLHP
jgi:hypothetical protein